MNAVAQLGPVAVVVDASDWSTYSEGVFDGCNAESPDINHGVVVVGYGVRNYIFKVCLYAILPAKF